MLVSLKPQNPPTTVADSIEQAIGLLSSVSDCVDDLLPDPAPPEAEFELSISYRELLIIDAALADYSAPPPGRRASHAETRHAAILAAQTRALLSRNRR